MLLAIFFSYTVTNLENILLRTGTTSQHQVEQGKFLGGEAFFAKKQQEVVSEHEDTRRRGLPPVDKFLDLHKPHLNLQAFIEGLLNICYLSGDEFTLSTQCWARRTDIAHGQRPGSLKLQEWAVGHRVCIKTLTLE